MFTVVGQGARSPPAVLSPSFRSPARSPAENAQKVKHACVTAHGGGVQRSAVATHRSAVDFPLVEDLEQSITGGGLEEEQHVLPAAFAAPDCNDDISRREVPRQYLLLATLKGCKLCAVYPSCSTISFCIGTSCVCTTYPSMPLASLHHGSDPNHTVVHWQTTPAVRCAIGELVSRRCLPLHLWRLPTWRSRIFRQNLCPVPQPLPGRTSIQYIDDAVHLHRKEPGTQTDLPCLLMYSVRFYRNSIVMCRHVRRMSQPNACTSPTTHFGATMVSSIGHVLCPKQPSPAIYTACARHFVSVQGQTKGPSREQSMSDEPGPAAHTTYVDGLVKRDLSARDH